MSMLKVRLERDWWSPEKHLYRKGENEIGVHLKGVLPKSAKILGEPFSKAEEPVTATLTNEGQEADIARASSDAEEKARAEADETARKQELAAALKRTQKTK